MTTARRVNDNAQLEIAIIGSGAAAFAAALRAVEQGAQVTMIEAGTLGGTCVNVGCVPSKIMIRAAQLAHWREHPGFSALASAPAKPAMSALADQIAQRVDDLRKHKYADILHANPAIRFVEARARFVEANTLLLTHHDGRNEQIHADRILIATGRSPSIPAIEGLAGTPYWTSTEALAAKEIPEQIVMLGGSVIAVELGQAFARLGSQVTLLARGPLLPRMDPDLGAALARSLSDEGMRIVTDCETHAVHYDNGVYTIATSHGDFSGKQLLVATGRTPNTIGLGLEAIGVELEGGAIRIDAELRTNVPGVFAAGDCTNLPQFVYVAASAGTHAAVNMLGGNARLDLTRLPAVVFSDPQVATVGLDEAQAARQGIATETRTLALEHVPRSLVNFDTRGFIKLVAERESGRLLGTHVLAAEAGEIIAAAALALRAGMTVAELASEMFAYLTMAEALKLCAQTFTRDVKKLSCCAG